MNVRMSSRSLWCLVFASLFAAATSVAQTFEVVRSLTSADGNDPQSGIVQLSNGDFAGTTVGGFGTLFKMDTWGRFGTIHAFDGTGDGSHPHAPLVLGTDGTLYGTTMNGALGWGTIFGLAPTGVLKTMKAFVPSTGGLDGEGAVPHAPLILPPDAPASHGAIYGVTTRGGMNDLGTIFVMDSSTHKVTTVHHFSGFDGATPYESLIEVDGRLYGTTPIGGGTNSGTIFRIDRDGSLFTVIHSFIGRDGARPEASLVAIDGVLYGTTYGGGFNGMGTVFKLDPSGAHFAVIHHFTGIDGANPHAALVQARDGQLYGTTYSGGGGNSFSDFGSIFRINMTTTGGAFSIVHRFSLNEGAFSQSRLIEASDGALYGTTAQGGSEGRGVIFRVVFVPVGAIVPSSGPASGRTVVAISGGNFHPGAALTFAGVDAGALVIASDSSITATTPLLPAGTLNDVLVDNPDNTRGGMLKGYFADFIDVPQGDIFHGFVEKIFRNRITVGVGNGNFGRNALTTRAQAAVFLLKAKHGPFYAPPAATGSIFGDVPATDGFASWIEQLHNEGIADGCNTTLYCPNDPMTREQMAITLLKAEHGSVYTPPACIGIFQDVPCSSDLAPWIEQLYNEGITGGCNGGYFCPTAPTTRGQTAVFLAKTFSLP